MQTTLYDISVATCIQVVEATSHFLDKAADHCKKTDLTVEELIDVQLQDDMRPLRYQIFAVALHSKEAMKALETGEFYRPESYPEEKSFAEMQLHLRQALAALREYTPEAINALAGRNVTVKIPNLFILSFSHVNLYFHASTAYNILRNKGVPLEKRDFLGGFRLVD